MAENKSDLMEKIVSLCKRRGFVFQGSEIYGGFAGTYDFGPYGVELQRNVISEWTKAMNERDNMARLDSSIFTAGSVWQASGHVSGFSDPLVICNECHSKQRADHLLESVGVVADEKMTEVKINQIFDENRGKVKCPVCGKKKFSKVSTRSLLATSSLGMFEEGDEQVYLRGETAQGIYINYKNILSTGMYSVPFGIYQVGKVFRNEISPRQFLFRKREFEQMEMQYFVHPKEARVLYEEWKKERMKYYERLGIKKEKLRWKQHENLVFYAKEAWDIQYEYPFGWNELEGIHYRGDYDLTQHQKFSGVDMSYFDEETKERFIPHIIETSVGVDRTMLMVLLDAYDEDKMSDEKRVVLRFKPNMAPVKVAVFPLLKNKPELVEKAKEIYKTLKKEFGAVVFDDNGNIGKRYRRQDEIGTPWCVTVDFETIEKDAGVTLRDRDTGEQKRMSVEEIISLVKSQI
ncbi:MAG: glycine--tRNA ligase [Candidatus Zambryskibacteria bacterium RIFCSPLOWO2_02_FULL_39_26]|uniref:glycine--tRNA ligase n=1 Tax=Candidatus Zambryskibacteria bacterium RIFCSPLOWO2_12_FULL_39_23 TaxID=1802776 RepID=A0A1G2UR53_9BACT|nr:MAG: glycine--tRNA ligase [Candidatus Zambryskibacteria bacterium RIFCSPHIGHO2_02_39_10]OHB00226.1 MAG: glycine--tRNA ligase [Candidatus Zambryskibacteria bacterium RIFCSPHIGHO2_12_FULL_39_47]OHB10045.1 MAG: glycine--tRNA ligase [Candidatus Zambryskibacteria bacterium RIFCSPLOWO2_02_FULL_39_26]OHB11875.1 MAG: glycine--tRNA ligase [Candidatus Zambryskibacteria bacterium RIFCSPLOWO2_12_FULL_39_23]